MMARITSNRRRRGTVLPVVTVCLVGLVGFIALAIDVGMMAVARTQCQNAADIAALAGARALDGKNTNNNLDAAIVTAKGAAKANKVLNQDVTDGQITTARGGVYRYQQAAGRFQAVFETPGAAEAYGVVQVTITTDQPTYFARIFGVNSLNVGATATAVHRPRDVAVVLDFSASMGYSSLFNYDTGSAVGSLNPDARFPRFGPWSIYGGAGMVLDYSNPGATPSDLKTYVPPTPMQRVFGYVNALNYYQAPNNLTMDTPAGPAIVGQFLLADNSPPAFVRSGGGDPWASFVNVNIPSNGNPTSMVMPAPEGLGRRRRHAAEPRPPGDRRHDRRGPARPDARQDSPERSHYPGRGVLPDRPRPAHVRLPDEVAARLHHQHPPLRVVGHVQDGRLARPEGGPRPRPRVRRGDAQVRQGRLPPGPRLTRRLRGGGRLRRPFACPPSPPAAGGACERPRRPCIVYRRRWPGVIMDAVAVFENVGKFYRAGPLTRSGVQAVKGVNLHVPRGTAFALLGPNRAGKTTLIKLLLSLARPTEGTISRLGRPARDGSTLARVGYVHENQHFPRYLTASELLNYYGGLSLVRAEALRPRVAELLRLVGLEDRRDEPIARFSKGMVQRLGLAQALVNEPELLVLDEPTEGLDLSGRQLLRDVIARQKARGATVLLVSHVLPEVEQACDRVAVVVGGRVARVADVADLVRDPRSGQRRTLEEALRPIYEGAKP